MEAGTLGGHKSYALQQYVLAFICAALLLAYQTYAVAQRFGSSLGTEKARVLQAQVLNSLQEHGHAAIYLALYLSALALSHVALCIALVWSYRASTRLLLPTITNNNWIAAVYLAAGVFCAVLWNRHLHPLSRAFENSDLLLSQAASYPILWLLSLLVLFAAATGVVEIAARKPRLTLLALASGAVLYAGSAVGINSQRDEGHRLPDVILLGVDSMRPDVLQVDNPGTRPIAPSISRELRNSVVFEDAITPAPRTFVSYMSLLYGQYPVTHRARFNLHPRNELDVAAGIPWQLKEAGYHTMFAIDESRFANFDESFGFDELIAPPASSLDFVLGSVYDSVATNLLLRVPLLGSAFRHVHGNRAAYSTYIPHDHTNKIKKSLSEVPGKKPLFFVSHLTLPHWPYLPASGLRAGEDHSGGSELPRRYLSALREADKQFDAILGHLRHLGRLDDAIIVIFSDHGEGFSSDRQWIHIDSDGNHQPMPPPFGHGSLAWSPPQSNVALGIQRYEAGEPQWTPRTVVGPVSLVDVAPTIAEVLGFSASQFDGRSMYSAIRNSANQVPEQMRFIENGIRSTGVEQASVDEVAVANEMAYLYTIQPDLRFEIRPDLLPTKIAQKQRGVRWHSLGLVADPGGAGSRIAGFDCWLLLDYTRETSQCVSSTHASETVWRMQAAACDHFSGDAEFAERWCTSLR